MDKTAMNMLNPISLLNCAIQQQSKLDNEIDNMRRYIMTIIAQIPGDAWPLINWGLEIEAKNPSGFCSGPSRNDYREVCKTANKPGILVNMKEPDGFGWLNQVYDRHNKNFIIITPSDLKVAEWRHKNQNMREQMNDSNGPFTDYGVLAPMYPGIEISFPITNFRPILARLNRFFKKLK